MAIANLLPHPELISPWFVAAAVITVAVGILSVFYKEFTVSVPEKAPKLASGLWPILGAREFFNARWDWHQAMGQTSPHGNWSYFVGSKPVIGVSGDASRKVFFSSSKLNLGAGYQGLFAGSPEAPSKEEDKLLKGQEADAHFAKRLLHVTRREKLAEVVPEMIKTLRADLDNLAKQDVKVIKPFETIYDYLFAMIVRVVGCNELAEDGVMRRKVLKAYHMVEDAGTQWTILFPKLPTYAYLKRMWGGAQIWMTFDKLIKERTKTGRREDDPLQYLMDCGDDTTQIISFVIGALYAGQLNSGINASWIISYLSNDRKWHEACYNEALRAVNKFVPDRNLSLADRLSKLPLEAWESDFPIIEACLRETIRITTPGSAFRQNLSTDPVPLNDKEVIPPGWFASYAIHDIHLDGSVYPDPTTFNPGRYVNEDGSEAAHVQGANDPNSPRNYTFVGWGVGRHPCLGMKFAKLEMYLMVAFWVAYFDFEVIKPKGRLPSFESIRNKHSAGAPKEEVLVQYWPRGEARPVS